MSLSVIVITFNEEMNIGACLQSVEWADEIIVVDSKSSDKTVEIAKAYTDKVVITDWFGYAENKRIALSRASCEWVLWLDADERVSPELKDEIIELLAANPCQNGFQIKRKAFFLGKWIKHCGWYPGYVLRLFRRQHGDFNNKKVHEGLEVAGEIGQSRHALLHYTDHILDHYLSKFNRYTTLAAKEMAQNKQRTNVAEMCFRSLFAFIKMYFFKLGILDGPKGFMLCLLSSGYVMCKYAKLWEIEKQKRSIEYV